REQRLQLRFIQFAQPVERVQTRKFADRDDGQLRIPHFATGEPVEQIDQMHLTKQIVFEPKNNFVVVCEASQPLVHGQEFGAALFNRDVVRGGQVLGAHL